MDASAPRGIGLSNTRGTPAPSVRRGLDFRSEERRRRRDGVVCRSHGVNRRELGATASRSASSSSTTSRWRAISSALSWPSTRDVRVVGEAAGVDAAALVARTRPDIMFLDIQMPEVDGFRLLELVGADAVPAIVFVTAYDRYALRAFEVHALDYLLKPVEERRFAVALEHAKKRARAHRAGEVDATARRAPRRARAHRALAFSCRSRGKVDRRRRRAHRLDRSGRLLRLAARLLGGRSGIAPAARDDGRSRTTARPATSSCACTVRRSSTSTGCARFIRSFAATARSFLRDGARVKLSRSRRKNFEEKFVEPGRTSRPKRK